MVSLLNPELAYWGSLAHPGLLWGSSVYLLSSGIIGSLPALYRCLGPALSKQLHPLSHFTLFLSFLIKEPLTNMSEMVLGSGLEFLFSNNR